MILKDEKSYLFKFKKAEFLTRLFSDFKLKCSCHYRFDGVHSVLCFFKDNGLCALKYLVGDLHAVTLKTLAHLAADSGVEIVECGQAMHEYCIG